MPTRILLAFFAFTTFFFSCFSVIFRLLLNVAFFTVDSFSILSRDSTSSTTVSRFPFDSFFILIRDSTSSTASTAAAVQHRAQGNQQSAQHKAAKHVVRTCQSERDIASKRTACCTAKGKIIKAAVHRAICTLSAQQAYYSSVQLSSAAQRSAIAHQRSAVLAQQRSAVMCHAVPCCAISFLRMPRIIRIYEYDEYIRVYIRVRVPGSTGGFWRLLLLLRTSPKHTPSSDCPKAASIYLPHTQRNQPCAKQQSTYYVRTCRSERGIASMQTTRRASTASTAHRNQPCTKLHHSWHFQVANCAK